MFLNAHYCESLRALWQEYHPKSQLTFKQMATIQEIKQG
jgi:hypothetical protein